MKVDYYAFYLNVICDYEIVSVIYSKWIIHMHHSKLPIKNKVTVFSFCNLPLKGHIMSFKMYIQRSSSNQYHFYYMYFEN